MDWTWRYEDDEGARVDVPEVRAFESRSEAESWLGENFTDLTDSGVAAVTLLEGDAEVYGPMSLSPGP